MEKMINLMNEAKHLLSDDHGIWSDADRRALEDMVIRAERALDGTSVPFTRNREFVKTEKHMEVSFAYDRYTMVPSFLEKGKVYGHYGLKEAVRWFREQDMSRWSADRLYGRKQERIFLERSRTTSVFPCEEEPPMLLYVRAEMDASRETEVRVRPALL